MLKSCDLNTDGLMPVVYIPHGGGPLPLLGEPNHKELIRFLKTLPTAIPEPAAIVMISAHWESNVATVSSASRPTMIYDYGGFPAEAYEYQYSAPGHPELANQIHQLLEDSGIACKLDPLRGFDHGTFVPLMLMYPRATLPVVQVSLLQSFDPKDHIALGRALAPLRKQGVLILGSGMSFHSFSATEEDNENFENWLDQVLVKGSYQSITESLTNWAIAPSARECHKREEHLLPLHICWGAVSDEYKKAERVFSGYLFKRRVSGFLWR